MRFNALMGLVFDPEGLRESFERKARKKAPGVDGMRKEQYGEGVEGRITELSERLRRMGYRPQPVRRVYLPKGDGRYRPLGIPCFEDRLVQDRLSQVLQAIWEPEFRDCSYGFRPGRSAHDALPQVAEVITNEGTQWVVEADIKGFFDHVSHTHLDSGFWSSGSPTPMSCGSSSDSSRPGSWKTGCSVPPRKVPRKGDWLPLQQ